MFTRNLLNQLYSLLFQYGCLNSASNYFSFITELTDLLAITLDLLISFIAYNCLFFFSSTFHTFPKPPRPITKLNTKFYFTTPW